ncbi:MAG: amidohydrolase family protein, partial [Myxococcota bacterium]|nr:amidohydrolase family protein [Myxococcota bacterium]
MNTSPDIIIENGRVFDGSGAPSSTRHLHIRDGRIIAISSEPLDQPGAQVIDATDQWVMPGFVDTHTHYDAELLVAPGLGESVRHGVTTVITGSCSLSIVYTNPQDAADMYARVEALPYEPVVEILAREKTWQDPEGWIQNLEDRPLGPNVASLLGHSDVRAHVMGLDRSTNGEKPTPAERQEMVGMVEDAMEAGFAGMSSMTN